MLGFENMPPAPSPVLAGLTALFDARRWCAGRLERFRAQRLRALVDHARRRVPFYRERLSANPRPRLGSSVEELLADLPVLGKADLQAIPATDLVTSGLDPTRLVVHTTSGSTGRPFSIRRSWFEEQLLLAFRLRESLVLGLRPTDRRVKVTFVRAPGSFAVATSQPRPWYTRFGLLRQELIHCLRPVDEILARLRTVRPQSLGGYPSALLALARTMSDADRALLRPRLLWSAGETLVPEYRREIEDGFATRVFDHYGTHEANLVAVECRETGLLHVLDEAVVVEVARDGSQVRHGEEGEVLITPLHSYAMPLLRFSLGDVAVAGPTPCPCGAPVTTLQRLVGRTVDYFPLADGSLYHPYRLAAPLLAAAPWLRQFAMVQEAHDLVVVRVVAWEPPTADQLGSARRALAMACGDRLTTRLDLVPEIPHPPAGKAQPYRSLVASPRSGG